MKWFPPLLALCFSPLACHGAEAPARLPDWNWDRFPQADRIQIALLPCQVGPARTESIRAPAAGKLRITRLPDPQTPLPADAEWGRIESPELASEKAAIQSMEADLKKRAKRYQEFEKDAALVQIEKEIRQAEDALALAEAAEKDPKLFKGDKPLLDPASRPFFSAKQYKASIEQLKSRKERISNADPDMEPADLQSLRAELERKKSRHEERSRQLVLKQPFAGHLLLADSRDGRFVNTGDPVGLAVSKQSLKIRIKGTTPLLGAAPQDTLEAVVTLPSGATITAPYTSTGFDPTAEDIPVLRFETAVAAEQMRAIHSSGIFLTASVHRKLEGPCRIVPKLLIAKEDRDDALAGGWHEAIAKLFPGAELRAEGRSSLAILPRKAP
jgi:hypothetical protein